MWGIIKIEELIAESSGKLTDFCKNVEKLFKSSFFEKWKYRDCEKFHGSLFT